MEGLNKRGLGLGAGALSGILLFAAGEPLGAGPLAWVALIPLFLVVLRESSWRWGWAYGLFGAFVYFGVHLSWIFLFGWMAWTALTLFLALYASIATLLASVLRRATFVPVFVAGAWTGVELARERWPVGGYSWGAVGTTQATVPGVRWLAGGIGVYGLTFLAVFVSALLAQRLVTGRWSLRSVAVVGAALVAFIGVDLGVSGSPPVGRPVKIAVVQGGVPRPPRPDQRDRILASHMRLTERLVTRGSVDLVVWPEDAIGIGVSEGAIESVQALARRLSTPFIVGHSVAESEDDDERFLNLVELINADGELAGTYQKRHPVPFGEYVPFGFLRNFVGTLQTEVPYDLRPGRKAKIFHVDGVDVATPICFESVFPRDILDFARLGAELYVVSTNNASFGRSYASQQHIAHARMRALETRQWVVQAALAGISGVMSPNGSVSHTTGLFTSDAFVAEVRARPDDSLYSRTGDLFPSLGAVATLIGLLSYALARRRGILPP